MYLVKCLVVSQGVGQTELPSIFLGPFTHRKATAILYSLVTQSSIVIFLLEEGVVVTCLCTVCEVLEELPCDGTIIVVTALILSSPVVIYLILQTTGNGDVLIILIVWKSRRIDVELIVETVYRTLGNSLIRTDLISTTTCTNTLGCNISQTHTEVEFQVLANLMIQLEVYIETVVTVGLHQTVVVGVSTAEVELSLFRTAANTYVVRL